MGRWASRSLVMEEWIKVNDNVWQKQTEIDWKQRRYEIAKDILAAWCSNPDRAICLGLPERSSATAVKYADALIKELKEK